MTKKNQASGFSFAARLAERDTLLPLMAAVRSMPAVEDMRRAFDHIDENVGTGIVLMLTDAYGDVLDTKEISETTFMNLTGLPFSVVLENSLAFEERCNAYGAAMSP